MAGLLLVFQPSWHSLAVTVNESQYLPPRCPDTFIAGSSWPRTILEEDLETASPFVPFLFSALYLTFPVFPGRTTPCSLVV